MYFRSLLLRQFRNHTNTALTFSPGLNFLVGPNGAGKSNLLEALHLLCTTHSYRGADVRQLIEWNKDGLYLQGLLEMDGNAILEIEIKQKNRRPRLLRVNGHPLKRLGDFVGRVPVTVFSPDDLFLVKGEPSLRRKFINNILSQCDAAYAEGLLRYNKVLAERNQALKDIQEGRREASVLLPWDLSLAKEGLLITRARRRFLEDFYPSVVGHHQTIASAPEAVELRYLPSFDLPADDAAALARIREGFVRRRQGEIALGSTLAGPHRDDIAIFLNGQPARDYASQGQARTLALSLKLAEKEFLKAKTGRTPLFLLDDVISELDAERRRKLAEAVAENKGQCFVTLTAWDDWPKIKSNDSFVFSVKEGCLFQMTKEALAL